MDFLTCVLTCPRPTSTLSATLESLDRAGFHSPRIFDGTPPAGEQTSPRWNVWANLQVFREILRSGTEAEGLLLVEDDVQWCLGAADYLSIVPWPGDIARTAVVSPYCCQAYYQPLPAGVEAQWHREHRGYFLSGAQAFIYPIAVLPRLIDDLASRDTPRGIDYHVGEWAGRVGLDVWVHVPSLAQHTGINNSAVGNGDCGTIHRAYFPGPDFDARSLLD